MVFDRMYRCIISFDCSFTIRKNKYIARAAKDDIGAIMADGNHLNKTNMFWENIQEEVVPQASLPQTGAGDS